MKVWMEIEIDETVEIEITNDIKCGRRMTGGKKTENTTVQNFIGFGVEITM